MSGKVVIAGKLMQWQVSDLHVGISIDAPTVEGDFAPPGRRVRVMVEAIESEPRCPCCGGEIAFDVILATAFGQESRYNARCLKCGAHGEGETKQAALDALAEWLGACPRCGGKAEYKSDWYMMPWQDRKIHYWYWAVCTDKECGVRSSQCDTKRAVAAWWNKREGRK